MIPLILRSMRGLASPPIGLVKSITPRTSYANKGATQFGTVAVSLNADIAQPEVSEYR